MQFHLHVSFVLIGGEGSSSLDGYFDMFRFTFVAVAAVCYCESAEPLPAPPAALSAAAPPRQMALAHFITQTAEFIALTNLPR